MAVRPGEVSPPLRKWVAVALHPRRVPRRCQIDQNTNRFWHLVGEVIGVDLPAMDYDARLQMLLEHRIGLWDVAAQARREGSLDGNIRDHAGNDLIALIEGLPALEAIAFDGGTAARIGGRIPGPHAQRFRILRMPPSSPAHASMNFAAKLAAWRALGEFAVA
ncbi:DNA-deoxyinosine glycosylase [Paraburkholderia sp. A1RO-5]|uniref:DNA-deoxyinosine glycosylase n=1 Tax=unclassified Paraburkholderia TaxID=2615204 RepID=UPI003BA2082B